MSAASVFSWEKKLVKWEQDVMRNHMEVVSQ